MQTVNIKSDYIKLGQLIKFVKLASSGAQTKLFLMDNDVYVNGVIDNRRGRKLYHGDKITINKQIFIIRKE